jgi:Asp/Glu/hydantoin racemase
MRIWHQGFIEMQTVPRYQAALESHLAAVCAPGTQVDIHGVAPGTYTPDATPADIARHAYLMSLEVHQILDNARRAEREGYDAVAIAILQNPGLREARTIVDIPVAGYGEAAMHVACMLGRRFAAVAFNGDLAAVWEAEVTLAGLTDRSAGWSDMDISYADVVAAFDRPGPVVDAFRRAAGAALDRGADVLIPGQTILAEVLWQNRVWSVDDAPVVDAVGTTIKVAELLVELRRISGVTAARRGYYGSKPPEALVQRARRLLK